MFTKLAYSIIFEMRGEPGSSHEHPGAIISYMMGPDYKGFLKDQAAARAQFEKLNFQYFQITAEDGCCLKARYYRNGKSKRTAILVHGLYSTAMQGYPSIGLEYVKAGWNLLLPDMRRSGESGGRQNTFGILECEDLFHWIRSYNTAFPGKELILHGKSLGAATICLLSSRKLPSNVKALVSDCAFADQEAELLHMYRAVAHISGRRALPKVKKRFLRKTGLEFRSVTPEESVRHASVPMFFVHGAADRYVPPANSQILYDACASEKKLLFIPGAGHTAACWKGGRDYYDPIFAFLDRYTAESKAEPETKPETDPNAGSNRV